MNDHLRLGFGEHLLQPLFVEDVADDGFGSVPAQEPDPVLSACDGRYRVPVAD